MLAHLGLRRLFGSHTRDDHAEGLDFRAAHADVTGGSDVDADRAFVGFHDVIEIQGASARVHLARGSRLASLTTEGDARVDVTVHGRLGDPVVDVDGAVDRAAIDGHPLGDIASMHMRYAHDILEFDEVRAHKGTSEYRVPALRIAFGHEGRLDIDALFASDCLDLREALSMGRLDDQPELASLGGGLAHTRANIRFVRGGKYAPDGKGALTVSVDTRLVQPRWFGRRFDSGAIDVDVRWNPEAGLSGVDVDVRTFELRDRGPSETTLDSGSVVASGRLIAGNVDLSLAMTGVPLSRLFPSANSIGSGRVSGLAQVTGTLDAMRLVADVELTAAHVRGADIGPASAHFEADFGKKTPLRATVVPESFDARLGEVSIRLRRAPPLTLADGVLTARPLEFTVHGRSTPDVVATLRGSIASPWGAPRVHAALDVPPVDLAALVGAVPQLRRADGTFALALTFDGPLGDPNLGGHASVRARSVTVQFIPNELRDLVVDVYLEPHVLRLKRLTARLNDGVLDVDGVIPIEGLAPGIAALRLRARGARLDIARGIDATLDADTRATISMPLLLAGRPHAVRLTGVVWLDPLVYRRPLDVAVDLRALGNWVARRHARKAPGVYDPAHDVVDLSLRLVARTPFLVDNDVAHARFVPEGPQGLWLRGTNQRPVLAGRLVALPGGKLSARGIHLDLARATLDFDDPESITPRIQVEARTEYRRVTQFEAPAAGEPLLSFGNWRISVRIDGADENLRVSLTSEPPLAPDDIFLLLTVGLTRAELEQMTATTGPVQAAVGLEAIATLGGVDRLVRDVVPIDSFRFGSEWSPKALALVPDVTLRKRITDWLAATVSTAIADVVDVRGGVQLELRRNIWLEALWENTAPLPATPIGDLGLGFRWRLEFH